AAQGEAGAIPNEPDFREGPLEAPFQGLTASSDARFATWRPGSGPPPVEPDPETYATPSGRPAAPVEAQPDTPASSEERSGVQGSRALLPAAAKVAALPADPLDEFFYRPDEEAAAFPTLGASAGDEPVSQRQEQLDEFLTFRLGKEEFAVAIDRVREVLRAPRITEVPRAPVGVLGVVTVRGEVVPVVDARARLGVAVGQGTGGRIVIVETGEGPLGVLVDDVASVVRLPRGAIEPCPQGLSAAASDCVTGIGRWRDRLFMLVDASTLLRRNHAAEGP
ncbi:MAG: chemotaxis protein CheW, partial [Anaeromyxobacteraceae bacterium]